MSPGPPEPRVEPQRPDPVQSPPQTAQGSSSASLKVSEGTARNCAHRMPRGGALSSSTSPTPSFPPFPRFGSSTTRRSTTRRIDAVGAPGGRKLRAGDWWGCGPSALLESGPDPVRAGRRGGRQARDYFCNWISDLPNKEQCLVHDNPLL